MCSYFGCLCEGLLKATAGSACAPQAVVKWDETLLHLAICHREGFPVLQGRRRLAHPWGRTSPRHPSLCTPQGLWQAGVVTGLDSW